MQLLIKIIWIIATIINISAVIWFIFGSTANFQRGLDLVSTIIFVYFGIPSILLITLSLFLLVRWIPSFPWGVLVISLIIICMLTLSSTLFKHVNTIGWLEEKITTDSLQITTDNIYEYQIELINLFQKNGHARLYLKSTSTNEEIRIPLDLPVKEIVVLFVEKTNYWIVLEETSEADIYTLYTTSKFPIPDVKYKVDVKKRGAVKVQ